MSSRRAQSAGKGRSACARADRCTAHDLPTWAFGFHDPGKFEIISNLRSYLPPCPTDFHVLSAKVADFAILAQARQHSDRRGKGKSVNVRNRGDGLPRLPATPFGNLAILDL